MYSRMFCLNNWDIFSTPLGVDAAEAVRFSWKMVGPQGQPLSFRKSTTQSWHPSPGRAVLSAWILEQLLNELSIYSTETV